MANVWVLTRLFAVSATFHTSINEDRPPDSACDHRLVSQIVCQTDRPPAGIGPLAVADAMVARSRGVLEAKTCSATSASLRL